MIEFNDVVVADVTGTGGFIEVQPRDGSGLDDNDALLIGSGYFDAQIFNSYMISVTILALENTGRMLPSF